MKLEIKISSDAEKILDDLDSDFSVLYSGKRYKKVSIADYGKCYMVIMERDD